MNYNYLTDEDSTDTFSNLSLFSFRIASLIKFWFKLGSFLITLTTIPMSLNDLLIRLRNLNNQYSKTDC